MCNAGLRMVGDSRCTVCGPRFMVPSPGDPNRRASVTRAAGRRTGHPQPGALTRRLTGRVRGNDDWYR